MIWCGIDPGLTGAVALLQGHPEGDTLLMLYDLPVMAHGGGGARVKSQLNPAALYRVLAPLLSQADQPQIVIERQQPRPGQGVSSVFSLGDTFGCVRGVLAALGLGYELVTPTIWKKAYRLGPDKELSRARALELYPDAAPYLERKSDHNRAEALLMADWLRRRPA